MPLRMSVAAYFYFDGKARPDSLGNAVTTDWSWAMQQFDRVAAAGEAVRSVVIDQSYVWGMPDPAHPTPNAPNAQDVRSKLQQCRAAGQLIYGYVAGSGGAVPLDPPKGSAAAGNSWWTVPRDQTKWWVPLTGPVVPAAPQNYPAQAGAYPSVREQIDLWYSTYPDSIDGIYVDQGPTDCLNAPTLQWAHIPQNWADYCQYIHARTRPGSHASALAYLLAAGYADVDPNRADWFEALPFDDVAVWEQGVPHYRNNWAGFDPCTPNAASEPSSVPAPGWWSAPGAAPHRIHIINNGVLAEATGSGLPWARVLCSLLSLAESRGSETVWITETQSSAHGSVYGFLPPYWDAEVALCTPPPAP
jgi:hypothetical protein